MARLEIELGAVNADLKRVLRESKIELSNFSKGLDFKTTGVNKLNTDLGKTKQLLTDITGLANRARTSLGGTVNSTAIQQERVALAQARTEAQNYRTESARLGAQMAALRAETMRNRNSITAAAGSYREAQQRLTALGRSIREAENGFRSTSPAIQAQIREYRALNDRLQNFDSAMGNNQRRVGNYERALRGVGGVLTGLVAGAFSVGAIVQFGKAVLDTTASFQKFGAVLSTSLGSEALSDLKLKEIQDFAAKTPFSVNELTGAFVKLANSGFRPTGDQMKSLGDLAASTGKTFDQLAEAILDAQTGEFERLKEFGIRAKDAGNSVIFTYRGVQTTVEKTSGSIRDYITNLGNAVGISGSMAKISGTLGGQISNLGDSWDQMLLSVGGNTQGVFSSSIGFIGAAINKITEFNRELEVASKYSLGNRGRSVIETLFKYSAGGVATGGGSTDREAQANAIINSQDKVSSFATKAIQAAKSSADFGKALAELKKQGDKALAGIGDYPGVIQGVSDAYQKGVKAIIDARDEFNSRTKADGNFGKNKKTGNEFSLAKVYEELGKSLELVEVQFLSTFSEKNQARISAYQTAINSVTREYGAQSKAVKDLQKEQLKLYQLPSIASNISANTGIQNPALDSEGKSKLEVDLRTKQKPESLVNKEAQEEAKIFKRELSRTVARFSEDLYQSLIEINTKGYKNFGEGLAGVAGDLAKSLTDSIGNVFMTAFSNQLTNVFEKAIGNLSAGEQAMAGAAVLLGSVVSGLFPKTSSGGQALGGALKGAGTGAVIGSAIPGIGTVLGAIGGGIIGALGGLFGAKKARKEEARRQAELEEQKKQTALLERANALAYTASIIGRKTVNGVVTGVEVNEFGQLTTKISGNDIAIVLDRAKSSRQRGV